MENLYGLPVIHDQDALSVVPAWSLQLARVIAARDAAIVAATGAVPEGDPDTVAGMVARLGALEALLDELTPDPWVTLALTNGWQAYSGGGGYYSGLRVRRTSVGIQIDGMVRSGAAGSVVAVLPDAAQDVMAKQFTAAASGSSVALLAINSSASHQGRMVVTYLSGPSAPSFVHISTIATTA